MMTEKEILIRGDRESPGQEFGRDYKNKKIFKGY